jgi:hypothetical protein
MPSNIERPRKEINKFNKKLHDFHKKKLFKLEQKNGHDLGN